jgi:acetyl esterase
MPTADSLDPAIAQILEMGRAFPPLETLPVAEARANMAQRVEMLKPFAPQGIAVTDLAIASPAGPLPLRLYRPDGAEGPLATLVWLHGGGWVLGSLDSHDNVCRFLAAMGPLLVISVDYRLAPEARAPAQQEDAATALQWAAANAAAHGGDPARLLVGGDSAGGNLAVLAVIAARSSGPRLAGQLLVYPVADYPADAHASYAENGDFGLTRAAMERFWGQWLADGAGPDATTAPLRAADLSGLPQAWVVLASHDVLRDEGRALAGRLEEMGALAGVDEVAGTIHGFFSMGGLVPLATETLQRAARWAASLEARA